MKNTKKIISLVLAICMLASLAISASAANTVDASGGTGTSSVTLSSTADGSIGGDPAATKMSVTVPTFLPIAVGTDGTVSTATDAKIVNNSFGAVKVNSVSIEAAQGWSLAAFGDKATLAHEKVNSNKFGFSLALGNGAAKLTDSKNASKQTLLDAAVEGCFMSGVGDTSANSIGIAYSRNAAHVHRRALYPARAADDARFHEWKHPDHAAEPCFCPAVRRHGAAVQRSPHGWPLHKSGASRTHNAGISGSAVFQPRSWYAPTFDRAA